MATQKNLSPLEIFWNSSLFLLLFTCFLPFSLLFSSLFFHHFFFLVSSYFLLPDSSLAEYISLPPANNLSTSVWYGVLLYFEEKILGVGGVHLYWKVYTPKEAICTYIYWRGFTEAWAPNFYFHTFCSFLQTFIFKNALFPFHKTRFNN